MPSAQGRMTVRRRPKDGENGLDAIDFKFIPSASSIVLQKDGTLRPSALSARLVKNEGGRDIDMTAQAFDGYTVLCHVRKSNGNTTRGYTPGTNITLSSSSSATLLSVDFELKCDGKVVASLTVQCIPAGIDGEDAVSILVSPENVELNFDKSVPYKNCRVKVNAYKGAKKLDYSASELVCSTLNNNGTGSEITTGLKWNFEVDGCDFYYTFMYIAGNDIDLSIPFAVTVDGVKYERAISVFTVKNGSQGIPGPTYKPLRVREWSKIANNTKLTTGLADADDWTDIVYILDNTVESGVRYWKCVKAFTKAAGQTPPKDSDTPSTNALVGTLIQTTNFGSLATDIFLANYALIRNLGVEVIDMRDTAGNILFQAKDGVVTCNTGNFKNVNITGNLCAQTLDLHVSTMNHNGDTSLVPNGSICLNADRLCLPELSPGVVRTIRILNPLETRSAPNNLILSRGSTNVRISPSLSWMDAQASEVTIAEKGFNGNAYLELLGYRKAGSSLTYWLTREL